MSDIKTCIISRWKDRGVIIEADFSQLEVIGLAFLSKDKMLRKDIQDGIDMHCLNASFLYNTPYEHIKEQVDAGDKTWEHKRKLAKGPGFLIQYGGGAELMHTETGLPLAACAEFIKKYYERYADVKNWQQAIARQVKLNRTTSPNRKTAGGFPAGKGQFQSITGRIYTFIEEDHYSKYNSTRGTSFKPTKMKNYPVQGFATGDIVPECCGRVFREIFAQDLYTNLLMINNVHDAIVFDCHTSVLDEALTLIKTTMEKAPQWLKIRFNIDFDMELPVDIKVGENWGNMLKINFN